MRIGVMLRSLDESYGIGMYTRYILKGLLEIDDRNEYLLMYRSPEHIGTYAHHTNVQEMVVNSPHKIMWDQAAVPWHAKRENIDLLFHTKFTVPLLSPCKTVMVLHGSEWFIYPQNYPWSDIQYVKLMMPLYLKRANLVISVSNRAKEDIITHIGVDPRKIKTVYLAPAEHFKLIKEVNYLNTIRLKYNLPERYFLFVGKIYPGKNVGNLLRAYAQIQDKVPHKLVICGDVYWKYDQDVRLIEELGLQEDVLRIGWIQPEELPAIYNLAELFVFPSMYESCPAPPWEAMACGCPVVTSNTGGTPEVVGDAALLVDPQDVNSIANAMHNVLTDENLRQHLIKKGSDQVTNYSWKKCAKETVDIFNKLSS